MREFDETRKRKTECISPSSLYCINKEYRNILLSVLCIEIHINILANNITNLDAYCITTSRSGRTLACLVYMFVQYSNIGGSGCRQHSGTHEYLLISVTHW
jgi:hypothetical protein